MKKLTIPSHSFLAIVDRELRAKGLKPVYIWDVYFNTISRKKESGVLLHAVEGHAIPFDQAYKEFFGILGFVNGEEPGEGSIPFHEILPKIGDTVALAYIIQGVYKGDFSQAQIVDGKALKNGEAIQGLHLIHQYILQDKDFKEMPYEIFLAEGILSQE